MKKSKGRLFVISSPSGGGKTTVIKELIKRSSDLYYSVSATTRSPRKGERDGIDYFFLGEETFFQKIEQEAFVEWAKVHGEYYGTLWSQIERCLKEGKRVLLDMDVQGGLNLKKTRSDAVLIFLLPPSMELLEKRLLERGTESHEDLTKRLRTARKEMKIADEYDFQVINDKLEDTVEELRAIIQSF